MSDGFDAPAAHLEMMYCIEQITFKKFYVLLVIDFNVLSLRCVHSFTKEMLMHENEFEWGFERKYRGNFKSD